MSIRDNELLARLAGRGGDEQGEAWSRVEATNPDHAQLDCEPPEEEDAALQAMLERIQGLTSGPEADSLPDRLPSASPTASFPGAATTTGPDGEPTVDDAFLPAEPTSLAEAKLSESFVESLVLKYLLSCGDSRGRDIAEQIRLPFALVDPLLRQMKLDQLVIYRGSAEFNDYSYQLTDLGRERARREAHHCSYSGAAPVSLEDYVASVRAQSIEHQHPTREDLSEAFEDLLISPEMMSRLGPAINSGRGMFLYGAAGNGKTSIAERVTQTFGQTIWIPRSLGIDGTIMRLFDPLNHEEAPLPKGQGLLDRSRIDRRWVRIRRPTIVVGGELTLDHLEVTLNPLTGISEAPLQLKSNCGTLVIDDFGRQRVSTTDLLNRWIVPLEKRYDFLQAASGKKIQVPFDQLIVFSTNLEPRDLVDDAFLRRIPYKIEVHDPSEEEFRRLIRLLASKMHIAYDQDAVDYLIERHYRQPQRPFRFCQPRDLLLQVRNYCQFHKCPLELTRQHLDFAVQNYFSIM